MDVPRRPEFTSKGVGDQKDHGTASSRLLTDAEFFGHARDRITVETGVEVHGNLDEEDERQDCPFLRVGEAEAQLVIAIGFCELDLAIARQVAAFLGAGSKVFPRGRGYFGRIGSVGTITGAARNVGLGHG